VLAAREAKCRCRGLRGGLGHYTKSTCEGHVPGLEGGGLRSCPLVGCKEGHAAAFCFGIHATLEAVGIQSGAGDSAVVVCFEVKCLS
jgi:hypothetical protein